MTDISWLHLSDLHLKSNNTTQISFLNEIHNQFEKIEFKPDFITFTGDITYSGKSEEYDLAWNHFFEPLLTETDVSQDRIFIVPGNHDVNRALITNRSRETMLGLLEGSRADIRDHINEFLADPNQYATYLKPLKEYQTFIRKLNQAHIRKETDYFYATMLKLKDYKIGLLGLNSVWLSGYCRNHQGNVNDQGNIVIGEIQLEAALQETKDADLRIALLHHPLAWLHEADQTFVINKLKSQCDIILRGHLHRDEALTRDALLGDQTTAIIPGAAIQTNRSGQHGYQYVQFNTETRQGTIFLRGWYPCFPNYRNHQNHYSITDEGTGGQIRFSLNQKVKVSVAERWRNLWDKRYQRAGIEENGVKEIVLCI